AHNLILHIEKVPISKKDHHYFQALKFVRADKWIVLPCPLVQAFYIFRPGLEPNIRECALSWDRYRRNKIVDLSLVSEAIKDANRGGFRLRLRAEFRDKLHAFCVADPILFVVAGCVYFNELHL